MIKEIELPEVYQPCKSSNHWEDLIIWGGCSKCGLGKPVNKYN